MPDHDEDVPGEVEAQEHEGHEIAPDECSPDYEPADDDLLPGSHPWIRRKTGLTDKRRNTEVREGRLVPFCLAAGRRGYLFRAGTVREWADQQQARTQLEIERARRRDAQKRGKSKSSSK